MRGSVGAVSFVARTRMHRGPPGRVIRTIRSGTSDCAQNTGISCETRPSCAAGFVSCISLFCGAYATPALRGRAITNHQTCSCRL